MRINTLGGCFFAPILLIGGAWPMMAQQEVFHPGETYDSLQAGQDAYADAEAQRRALIGRQLLIEDQIMRQNTWADPQDRYRPVSPESFGPVLPKSYVGPTLADVYAYPPTDGGPVYYGGPAPIPSSRGASTSMASSDRNANFAAAVPVFQPWPRVPNDIWATPYYGYVRQPIGHVKIWTSRLGYIYKPIYASPPMDSPRPAAAAPVQRRRPLEPEFPAARVPQPPEAFKSPPPPPRPAVPPPARMNPPPGDDPAPNPPVPGPARAGQEI